MSNDDEQQASPPFREALPLASLLIGTVVGAYKGAQSGLAEGKETILKPEFREAMSHPKARRFYLLKIGAISASRQGFSWAMWLSLFSYCFESLRLVIDDNISNLYSASHPFSPSIPSSSSSFSSSSRSLSQFVSSIGIEGTHKSDESVSEVSLGPSEAAPEQGKEEEGSNEKSEQEQVEHSEEPRRGIEVPEQVRRIAQTYRYSISTSVSLATMSTVYGFGMVRGALGGSPALWGLAVGAIGGLWTLFEPHIEQHASSSSQQQIRALLDDLEKHGDFSSPYHSFLSRLLASSSSSLPSLPSSPSDSTIDSASIVDSTIDSASIFGLSGDVLIDSQEETPQRLQE